MKELEMEIVRFGFGRVNSTLGEILGFDGKHICHTIEDGYKKVKVYGETCIPEGRYRLYLRNDGRLHTKYKSLHPDIHRGMIFLDKVPQFEGIAVHRGISPKDSLGCPCLGRRPQIVEGEFVLGSGTSAEAYVSWYEHAIEPLLDKVPVYLRVSRRPEL